MHAQYVPVLTDIAPLLLIRELPQDEYPTPALPRPFTSHDVEPVMFEQTEHNWVYQAVWRSLRRLHRQWSTFWWEVLHAVERENGCFIENYHRYYIFRIAI